MKEKKCKSDNDAFYLMTNLTCEKCGKNYPSYLASCPYCVQEQCKE